MIDSPARSPRRPWRAALLVAALAAAPGCHDDPTAPGSARLVVDVHGLPARASAALTVSGPGGFERSITSGITLSPLAPGGYLVRAADVVVGDVTYQASPAAESVFVDRAREPAVSVSYAPRAAGNFSIARLTLLQSVQTPDTRVPLVAGRDALLRVFVLAGADSARFPQLRVRYYRDGALLESSTIARTSGTVPTQLSDFPLRTTMNVVVPAALVQPGLQITAEVDPDNAIGEETEQDNRWPRDGGLVAVSVRAVPPLRLRLVPVAFGGANAGRVSSQTMAAFVGFARELYPLGAAEVDVRAPFAASATSLRSRDENGAWEQTLSELNAARVASGDGRMYFGLVRLPYVSGIVGVGMLPGMTALGWDALPDAAFTLAHELGHNWGRRHSPCGSPPGVDDQYPYLDGSIGVTGYRFSAQELQQPDVSDVMGYCRDAWISDYTYDGVLSFRGMPPAPRPASTTPRPALLVWGRVRDGEVVLEPAFPVTAPVSLPAARGPYRFTAIDVTGRTAFSVAFDATPTADGADGGAAFAFAIPYDAARDVPLARLQVDGGRRPAVRLARAAPAAPGAPGAPPTPAAPAPALSVTRAADGAATLRWDATAYPMAMVREAATGTILGFVRGGAGQVPADSGAVEVVISDGVQTRVSRH